MEASTVNDNSAVNAGGVLVLSGSAVLRNSTVSGNLTGGNGGGMLVNPGASALVENSTLA